MGVATRKPVQLALLLLLAGCALFASAKPAAAGFEGLTIGGGQLDTILVANDLSCQVFNHNADTGAVWPPQTGDADCGTFIFIAGQLWGPKLTAASTALPNFPDTYLTYTPVSQQYINGDDTIMTVVDLGATGLRLTQYDYVGNGRGSVGPEEESWETLITLTNNSGAAVDASILRGLDCRFSLFKYGYSDGIYNGAAGCATTAANNPPGQIVQIMPLTRNYSYEVSAYENMWFNFGIYGLLGSTCTCGTDQVDVAVGLQWYVSPQSGQSVSAYLKTTYSTSGERPVRTEISSNTASPAFGEEVEYTITLHNPNPFPVTINRLVDLIGAPYAYVPGSTTGLTSADPLTGPFSDPIIGDIGAPGLSWSGPWELPANSSPHISFRVRATSQDFGAWFNTAYAIASTNEIFPFYFAGPLVMQPFELFEGWTQIDPWPGNGLFGVPAIISGLDSGIDPDSWTTIAHYDGAAWQQTFRNAPLPSFNTLLSVDAGADYWLFVESDATLVFP